MESLQRNGGTAGILAALFLALFFLLLITSGLRPAQFSDPATAIPSFTERAGFWRVTGIAGALAAGLGVVFFAILFRRLREGAPTRATAMLSVAFIGLTAHSIGALLLTVAGPQVAAYAAKDQVAASHAWVALDAVASTVGAAGNAFLGTGLVLAGWAITATAALPAPIGWLALAAGVVTILAFLAPGVAILSPASILLIVIWLAWAGLALRRAEAAPAMSRARA